jgi:hypothetical protein
MNEEFAIPDVHADPEALRSMLQLLPKEPQVVFLGDIVNKGPSSLGAIKLLREASNLGTWTLLWGKHDILFVRAMLGSLDAQLKLFTQSGGTTIFAEIDQPRLGERVAQVFALAQANKNPFDYLSKEHRLISEVNNLFGRSRIIVGQIHWMINKFRLYYVSPTGVLYVHAGIPLTPEGKARFSLDDLKRLCKNISSHLHARELDTTTFEILDISEESPIRAIKWVNMIDDPKNFCKLLSVRAIVVGHSEISVDTLSNEPFPIVRHDFGAARCKGKVPSVLQIDLNHRFITHVRIHGEWQTIDRGILS